MKFVLDECVPARFAVVLRILFPSHAYTIEHLVEDLGYAATPDPTWIAELPDNEQCVIVTRDTAMHRAVLERAAWKRAGHVVIFLAGQWGPALFYEQAWRIVRWWPAIVETVFKSDRGVAYKVPWSGTPKPLKQYD